MQGTNKFLLGTIIFFSICCSASAATQIKFQVSQFDAQGLTTSTLTVTADTDKTRTDNSLTHRTTIIRDDLRKRWILNTTKEIYQEFDLTFSTTETTGAIATSSSGTLSAQDRNVLKSRENVDISTEPAQLLQKECRLITLELEQVYLQENTKKEVRRFNYRTKIWAAQEDFVGPDLRRFPQMNGGEQHDIDFNFKADGGLRDFSQAIIEMMNEIQKFNESRIKLISQITPPFLRHYSSTVVTNNGKEISFKKQAKTAAHQQVDVGLTIVDAPTLVINAAVFGAAHGLKAMKAPATIPSWVLAVDLDFAKHGGQAQAIETLTVQQVSDNNLFEIPAHYKKVDKL